MNSSRSSVLHPAGEAVFTFPTYGGNVRLCPTDDALTPFGGLVPWAAFQKQCGIIEGKRHAEHHLTSMTEASETS